MPTVERLYSAFVPLLLSQRRKGGAMEREEREEGRTRRNWWWGEGAGEKDNMSSGGGGREGVSGRNKEDLLGTPEKKKYTLLLHSYPGCER